MKKDWSKGKKQRSSSFKTVRLISNIKIPAFAGAAQAGKCQINVKTPGKIETEAKVEKKLNLNLNLNLHEVRKPQPQALPLFQNVSFDIWH